MSQSKNDYDILAALPDLSEDILEALAGGDITVGISGGGKDHDPPDPDIKDITTVGISLPNDDTPKGGGGDDGGGGRGGSDQ